MSNWWTLKQQVQQSDQHATKSIKPKEQAKESNQQTKTSQQLDDDLKQQPTSLTEETLELKEDSMMKEKINEIVKPIPILQHVQQVKDVPIVDFLILEKFNVPIGEKDGLLSSWFQWTTKRRTFALKIFILCQGCYTKG